MFYARDVKVVKETLTSSTETQVTHMYRPTTLTSSVSASFRRTGQTT